MRPVYFPFTYISEASARTMERLFGPVAVYQPDGENVPAFLHKLEAERLIDIRVPIGGDEELLRAELKAFHQWVDLHPDPEDLQTVYHQSINHPIPFYQDSSISKIRDDIKRKEVVVPSDGISDFQARLFLCLAQSLDIQIDSIDRELRVSDHIEHHLFKTLQGDSEAMEMPIGVKKSNPTGRAHDRNLKERIVAWSRLFIKDDQVSNLFLTDYPAVMDAMPATAGELKMILSLDHIPARIPASDRFETWQRELTAYLSDLSERSWSETEEDTLGSIPVENVSPSMQIAFYIATDRSPNKFFQTLSGGEPFRSVRQKTKLNPANTLIGVISFEGDNS